ncbi:hypothetical protein [Candidatus Poriferisodalis sp.]|uniref:hypothetical protein n=1 Tax=Candidatus Poriferisodalis sp. TaxID=3101277 RepID=UPI003B022123
MRTVAGTSAPAADPRPGPGGPRAGAPRPGDDRGLVTLEWLLIVGAAAGLAAASALLVQRVVDTAADAPGDPLVRVLDADIAAAFIAGEANAAVLASSYGSTEDSEYRRRCQRGLASDFADVVTGAAWTTPVTAPPNQPGEPGDPGLATLATPARCTVVPRPGLGG